MPYLRLTCPPLGAERRGEIARGLTDAVVELFTPPRGPVTAADVRTRTTIHFTCYAGDELFIGGQTPDPNHRTSPSNSATGPCPTASSPGWPLG